MLKEKLKSIGLSDEDITKVSTAAETMINEAVEERVTAETEKIKAKYDTVAEEYCQKKINEGVEATKKDLILEYDQKVAQLEDKVHKEIDLFLENEINTQISDDMLKKIAINETLDPVVKGIKKVLEENFISIDADGASLLKESKEEILKLRDQLSEAIADKMQLNERLEKVASHLLISESTKDLNEDQKKRVVEMFKGKSFDETEEKINGFVEFLVESDAKGGDKTKKDLLSEGAEPAPASDPAKVPEDPKQPTEHEDVVNRADQFMP